MDSSLTDDPDNDDWGDEHQTVVDAILAAAIHNEHTATGDVYCLGPALGRVNFVSQQIRAFNLAWALHASDQLEKKGKNIAVIGAGLSGLTVAAALVVRGATVTIFEAHKGPMAVQQHSPHRFVYPLMNWWPEADGVEYLNPTSNLPFLNWRANECDGAAREITATWEDLVTQYYPALKVDTGKTFMKLHHLKYDEGKVVVEYQDSLKKAGNSDYSDPFDIVILAVGFGLERKQTGFKRVSYWTDDKLEATRDLDASVKHFLISGIGDGGLIDALRLAFNFDSGKLAYQMALLLHGSRAETKLRDLIQRGTSDAQKAGYEAIAMDILRASDRLAEAKLRLKEAEEVTGTPIDQDEAASKRSTARNDIEYFSALLAAEALAHKSIYKKQHFITLLDRTLSCPLRGQAAPIYKLLTAMAVAFGAIKTEVGEAKVIEASNGPIAVGVFRPRATKPLLKLPYKSTKVIIRHGADQLLKKHMSAKSYRETASVYTGTSRFNHRPAWGKATPYPKPPIPPEHRKNYRINMRVRAEAAYQVMGVVAKVSFQDTRFTVWDYTGKYRPGKIYGYTVAYGASFEDMPVEVPDA